LIQQHRIPVRVDQHAMSRSRRHLIGFHDRLEAVLLDLVLHAANIFGIEGERVLGEHSLEKAKKSVAALEDEPVILFVVVINLEAEFLVKGTGSLDILDSEAERKTAEVHEKSSLIRLQHYHHGGDP